MAALTFIFWHGFPLVPIEGDDAMIAAYIEQQTQFGDKTWIWNHRRDHMPLSYELIALLARSAHLDAMTAFGLLSLFGALAFIVLSGVLAGSVARLSAAAGIVLTVFLFEEVSVAAWYANTSVLAGVFVALALVCVARPPGFIGALVAGAAVALATLCRIDAVAILPAVLVASVWSSEGNGIRCLPGLVVLCACLLTGWLAGMLAGIDFASVGKQVSDFQAAVETLPPEVTTLSAASFLPPLTVALVGLGLFSAVRFNRRLFVWTVLAAAPYLVFYGLSGLSTPKYWYFVVLPFAALIAYGLSWLEAESKVRRWSLPVLAVLAALQFIWWPSYFQPGATHDGWRAPGNPLLSATLWSWGKWTQYTELEKLRVASVWSQPDDVLVFPVAWPSRTPLYLILTEKHYVCSHATEDRFIFTAFQGKRQIVVQQKAWQGQDAGARNWKHWLLEPHDLEQSPAQSRRQLVYDSHPDKALQVSAPLWWVKLTDVQ